MNTPPDRSQIPTLPQGKSVRTHHASPSKNLTLPQGGSSFERGEGSPTKNNEQRTPCDPAKTRAMSKAKIAIAKALRKNETKAESLLWELLRGKQLYGLKFRRQHPIDPYFADFACVSKKIVIELDGGYHDHTVEQDLKRQKYLEEQGWKVLRFSNEDVLEDAEAVTRAIAAELGLTYEFVQRPKARSGMMNRKSHPLAFLATFPGGRLVLVCLASTKPTTSPLLAWSSTLPGES